MFFFCDERLVISRLKETKYGTDLFQTFSVLS